MNPLDLHAYADGELSPEQAAAIKELLRNDPKAAAEYNAILNLKDFTKASAPKLTSDEAWKACQGRLRELDRSSNVEFYVRKYAWGLCAAFFICILSARFFVQGVQGQSVQSADLLKLSNGLISKKAPDNSARDQWLDGILGHAKQAISTDQITILGGSTGFVDGTKVSSLDITDGQGLMRLIIVRGQLHVEDSQLMPGSPAVHAGTLGNSNCVSWNVNNMTVILAAPRTFDELQSIASRVAIH